MLDTKEACKPSSVPDAPASSGDHLSSRDVAVSVLRPTRGRAGTRCPPIRPCSEWGLPGPPMLPSKRCALTAPFHPYLDFSRGGVFLWHCPSGRPAPQLAGILPGGARTFLSFVFQTQQRSPSLLGVTHCNISEVCGRRLPAASPVNWSSLWNPLPSRGRWEKDRFRSQMTLPTASRFGRKAGR